MGATPRSPRIPVHSGSAAVAKPQKMKGREGKSGFSFSRLKIFSRLT